MTNSVFATVGRSSGLCASMVLVLGLAAGCTKLGPDFQTPEAPQEEAWLEQSDPKALRLATQCRVEIRYRNHRLA